MLLKMLVENVTPLHCNAINEQEFFCPAQSFDYIYGSLAECILYSSDWNLFWFSVPIQLQGMAASPLATTVELATTPFS